MGAWRLHNSLAENWTVRGAFFESQFKLKADECRPCGASLWNWTAIRGWPIRFSSHDAGILNSSGMESSLETCLVSLHLCTESLAGFRLLLWLTTCFAS